MAKRPERAGDSGPLRLDLTVRGGLQAQVSVGGTSVAFLNNAGSPVLTYGGLKAWDADGKTVAARFAQSETTNQADLAIFVEDADARYPITVDPIAQQAYLKASDAKKEDTFGYSVAVSGNTVAVGAPNADGLFSNMGAVYVLVKNEMGWMQQARFTEENSSNRYGVSVALDGDTLACGGIRSDYTSQEHVRIWVRNGTSWTLQQHIEGNNHREFATSLALSGDTLVVGAPTYTDGYGFPKAYVFYRSGGVWTKTAELSAPNGTYLDRFGQSVAISGNTLVVGAPGENSSATGVNGDQTNRSAFFSGAAYVFTGSQGSFSLQAYLKASNTNSEDWFGGSVGICGDTIVVGAPLEDSAATGINGDESDNSAVNSGAVYVFIRDGQTWMQQAYLKSSNSENSDDFGQCLAVRGNTLVVGAPREGGGSPGVNGDQASNSLPGAGAAYVFVRSGDSWMQRSYIKASNPGESDEFGCAVCIDGDTVAIGARGEDSNAKGVNGSQSNNLAPGSGAVYVFSGLGSYTLAVTSEHGDVIGAGELEANAIAEIIVNPHPGYLFASWTGDATGMNNPLSIFMNTDKTINATFGPDTRNDDGDGLSNYEEIVVRGTNPALEDTDGDGVNDGDDAFPLDPDEWLDTDGDGFLDGYEVLTGKSPLDPLDKPALVAEARTAIEFTFPSAVGKTYRIEASTDLAAWEIVETGIAGNGGQIQRFYSTREMPKRYFRVEEDAP